jgi:hypothetical protein
MSDTDKYNGVTSYLTISNKNLDCKEVFNLLKHNGIICNISNNKSIVYNNSSNVYEEENGCNITLCGLNPKYIKEDLWGPLSKKFNLDCAHLEIKGYYIGCIRNFIRKSDCPGKTK